MEKKSPSKDSLQLHRMEEKEKNKKKKKKELIAEKVITVFMKYTYSRLTNK